MEENEGGAMGLVGPVIAGVLVIIFFVLVGMGLLILSVM